jgi:radical SAM protein with 4Fe4S-binding SPASM domain
VHTVLKTTFMRQNIGSFEALRKLANELGAGFVFSFTVIPTVDNSRDVLGYRLTQEQLEGLIARQDWMVDDIRAGGVHVFEPLCSAGFNSFYISPYGEVFPCVTLRKPCGNIAEQPLSDIWGHDVFRSLRAVTLKDLPRCAECELSYYCDRCAGLAWMEEGNMLGVSTNDCTLARVRRNAIMRKKREAVADAEEKEAVH